MFRNRDRAIKAVVATCNADGEDPVPLGTGMLMWCHINRKISAPASECTPSPPSAFERQELPFPIRAGIAHYEFATIHPYYDGNGRTPRLLTMLIFHLGGYDLRGLCSLEEYYARNLGAYYEALTVGPSHNYYEGCAKANSTKWVEYFCAGVADSFKSVRRRAAEAASSGAHDRPPALRRLDPRQRKAVVLFKESDFITSSDVAELFSISERAARNLLTAWVVNDFVVIAAPAKKSRKYELSATFKANRSSRSC